MFLLIKNKKLTSRSAIQVQAKLREIFPRVVNKMGEFKQVANSIFKRYCIRESCSDQSFRVNGTNTDEVYDSRYGENMKRIHYCNCEVGTFY